MLSGTRPFPKASLSEHKSIWDRKLTFVPVLQRARAITQSFHREESGSLLRNRPHGTLDARWTHASIHGIGLGICLGITGDFFG